MSATCPSCGVAVVPGYVRCPKCHKPLPAPAVMRATNVSGAGGTALASSDEGGGGFPVGILAIAVLAAGGIAAFFALRGGDKAAEVTATQTVEPAIATQPTAVTPNEPAPIALPSQAPAAPDPGELGAELDRALKKAKLWGTVEVIGARVDVRTGACEDPGMAPLLDARLPALKGAGLTKLRCLEQSGRVVFERDL